MFSWWRWLALRAPSWNRSRLAGAGTTLRTTSRFSSVSRARYTAPPAPLSCNSPSYLPRRRGLSAMAVVSDAMNGPVRRVNLAGQPEEVTWGKLGYSTGNPKELSNPEGPAEATAGQLLYNVIIPLPF